MEKSKEQLARDYIATKQEQSLGGFSGHELFIMRFAFMAGYDAKPRPEQDITKERLVEWINSNGFPTSEIEKKLYMDFKLHSV